MKIRDRLLLGALAGLGANAVKLGISAVLKRRKLMEITGPEIAAGAFIPPERLASVQGKTVGFIADAAIAGILGWVMVNVLSVTGKNQAALKGALLGQIIWQSFYGLLGSFGVTAVEAPSPKTVLSELAGHTAFGAAAAIIASQLGDEGLFSGQIPFSASSGTG